MNTQTTVEDRKMKYFNIQYYKKNLSLFIFLLIFIILQIILVIKQVLHYIEHSYALIIARAAGILLNFNMSLIIILVLGRLLTWLRNYRILRISLPIEDFLKFHKRIGIYILILSIIHTIGHCLNFYYIYEEMYLKNKKHSISNELDHYFELLFTRKSKLGWIYSLACPTGWAILILMIFIDIFTIPQIRNKRCFQMFLNIHRLYVIVYILTFLHCENFWKWFIGPTVLVLFEFLLRFFQVKSKNYGLTHIKEVNLLPSGVTHLIIKRPKNFNFKAGDYIRIKIPVISASEYHAFTISSAPEDQDEISLHIRKNGDWTSNLYQFFSDYTRLGYYVPLVKPKRNFRNFFKMFMEPETLSEITLVKVNRQQCYNFETIVTSSNKFILLDMTNNEKDVINKNSNGDMKILYNSSETKEIKNVFIDVNIIGPYGSMSRHVFHSEHAILIASGIGITPFSSILQSLWKKHSATIRTCTNCSHQSLDTVGVKKLKKIDFIWIFREYESFEWFMNLLGELEIQQSLSKDKFIDIHLYWTDEKFDSSFALQKLTQTTSIIQNNNLRTKIEDMFKHINKGRPNFMKLFQKICENSQHKEKEVYFCGNKIIGKIIKKECLKFNMKFSCENF